MEVRLIPNLCGRASGGRSRNLNCSGAVPHHMGQMQPGKTAKSKLVTAVCLSAMAIYSTGCSVGSSADRPTAPRPTQVSVLAIQPTDVSTYSEYSAQTFARDLVEVRGRVDGFIQKRLFQVGSDVKEG